MNLLTKMTDKDSNFGKLQDITGNTILKYWPIILGFAMVLLSTGGIYVKLEYIQKGLDRGESQFTTMNDRQNLTGQSIIEMRGQISNLSDAVSRTNSNLSDTNRKVEILYDKARWNPK